MSQLVGSLVGIAIALTGGFIVYGIIKKTIGIRMTEEEEFNGADLTYHRIASTNNN